MKMNTLMKLYKSCIIPSITYACECWIITKGEEKILSNIQTQTLKKIMKVPDSTPNAAILGELGEKPMVMQYEEKQIIFLWDLIHYKNRCNDIFKIQVSMGADKRTIVQLILEKLKKYEIEQDISAISNLTKRKWKKIVKHKVWKKANEWFLSELQRLSKLETLKRYKQEIKLEKYVTELSRSEATLIFKSRTRMLNTKNNFRNSRKSTLEYPRCQKENR